MKHRIFIAINLPEKIKNNLIEYRDKWPELPVRWTKKENLHITLEFLGYLTDEELIELLQKTKEIASGKESFILRLNKVCYGPTNKKSLMAPRMVWVVGEKVKEFNLTPHITLGRLKTWQWKQMEPEERPEVSEDINLSFEVNSIEVMGSQLKRMGPEYTILESFRLK